MVVVVISRTTGLLLSPLMASWSLEVQGLPRCCHGDNYLSRGGVTRPEHMLIHRRIWFVVVFSLLTPGPGLDISSLSYCVCLCVLASMSYCMCQSFIHSLHASLYNEPLPPRICQCCLDLSSCSSLHRRLGLAYGDVCEMGGQSPRLAPVSAGIDSGWRGRSRQRQPGCHSSHLQMI